MAEKTIPIKPPEIKLEKHTLYLVGTAPLVVPLMKIEQFPSPDRKS